MTRIRKAQRRQAKLKCGISSASGFGKTYSAILLAKGLAGGSLSDVCFIDTENESADLYSNLGDFSVLPLAAPFSPEAYINAINEVVAAGFRVLVIDSTSHEWEGKGGCLDIHSSHGGRFQDWSKVTPRHNAFIQSILQAPIHVIITTRRKQEWEIVKDVKGTKVEKKGTKEVQRSGLEYELTLNFEITNENHLARASKDRTGLFDGRPEFVITEETGRELLAWTEKGIDPLTEAIKEMKEAGGDTARAAQIWRRYPQFQQQQAFFAAKEAVKTLHDQLIAEGQAERSAAVYIPQ